jgi:glycerophosphoryl diester phosphodiesterase
MKLALLGMCLAMPLSVFAEPASDPPGPKTALIGHRGSSDKAPENTLAAFRLAYNEGAEGCELDFRSTKDHKLIVSHDDNTKRCTGVDLPFSQTTFDELRKIDFGQYGIWKNKGFSEIMPTLEEALATVPPGRRMILHCYCHPHDFEKIKEPILRSKLKPEQVILLSHDLNTCVLFKKLMPNYKAWWLQGTKKNKEGELNTIDDLIAQAKAAGIDGLDLDAALLNDKRFFQIDKAFVAKVRQAGLELHTYIVDDVETARHLVEAGVDSITTNRPGWLREQLNRANGPPKK